jgi:hypothetical protein
LIGIFGHERGELHRGPIDALKHGCILEPEPRDLHGDRLAPSGDFLKADQKERITRPIEEDRIRSRQAINCFAQPFEILKVKSTANDKVHGETMP